MSKRKAIIGTAAFVCLLFVCFNVLITISPYHRGRHWSALYFDADLTKIYGESLDELKDAYEDIRSLDYYEINTQFLEISSPSISEEFLYGFEDEYPQTQEIDGRTIYLTKCFQLSENCFSTFEITAEEGRVLSEEDMEYTSGQRIPVLAGYEYINSLRIGDLLEGVYIQNEYTFEVVGLLSKGSNISLDGRAVSLDRYLVMPSFHIHSDPTDEEDDTFQVRHYANKLSGKLYYDSLFEFTEFYRRIYQINKIFQTEGKIIW